MNSQETAAGAALGQGARHAIIKATLYATAYSLFAHPGVGTPCLPDHSSRPQGYGVHLSKAERRGKTWQELQALRQGRNPGGAT